MATQNVSDDEQKLFDAATKVRANSYAPFSQYYVGAAIIDENGALHIGCNVENSSFPEGACAEANAVGAMIAAGGKRIVAIAAVGGHDDLEACTPCGGCRQRIFEFGDENTRVILKGENDTIEGHLIYELLPGGFRLR
jgi:cytidine deaminase